MLEHCPDCNSEWRNNIKVFFRKDPRWGDLRIEKCKTCGYENY